jgi:flagellar hook-length control protein FliK
VAQAAPLIVHKGSSKQADQVKKGKNGKKKLPGNKDKDFTKHLEKAETTQSLAGEKAKGKSGSTSLLRLISEVVRSITEKLSKPLQKKVFSFVKDLLQSHKFSEKEKGVFLSSLLKKFKKQKQITPGEIDDLAALLASINTCEKTGKTTLLTSLLDRLKEVDTAKGTGKQIKQKLQEGDVPRLVVIDLRKKREPGAPVLKPGDGNQSHQVQDGIGEVKVVRSMEGSDSGLSYFSMQEHESSLEQGPRPGNVQASPRGFDQEMLQKLKNSLDTEMVKQTKLIIKQGGNGEIRIVLKPESLGQIRMRLYLDNNHIEGRIFVENNNIRGVVEQSLESLQTALKQEGYDSVALQVSVGHGDGREQQGKSHDFTPSTEAVEEFEKNGEMLIEPEMQYARVNLVI